MSVLTIIQASSRSVRLPGKIALPINGKSILAHLVQAAQDPKVVAIPSGDEVAAALCMQAGVRGVEGPFKELIASYIRCLTPDIGWILRLTADCPMLTRKHVEHFLAMAGRKSDTIYTNRPWDPDGYDMELFSVHALSLANKWAKEAHDREHVTPWMYRHLCVERFSILGRSCRPEDPLEKCSVDTEEDYMKVRDLMEYGL